MGRGLERIREHNQGRTLLTKHIKPCTSLFGEFRVTAYAAFLFGTCTVPYSRRLKGRYDD